ncbi:hypothetical protein [Streptococcus suis]|uniref:hypothetical protein n=1 Tax=Streptococcus suis TaxID=1307 RepID=UPI0014793D67
MFKTFTKIQDISQSVTSNKLIMQKKHTTISREVNEKIRDGENSLTRKIDAFNEKYGHFF